MLDDFDQIVRAQDALLGQLFGGDVRAVQAAIEFVASDAAQIIAALGEQERAHKIARVV